MVLATENKDDLSFAFMKEISRIVREKNGRKKYGFWKNMFKVKKRFLVAVVLLSTCKEDCKELY